MKIYPKNDLLDDVLFELASAYSQKGEDEEAIKTYDKLLSVFERSPFLAKSSLNKGLILYNLEKYELAKEVLEKVALDYNQYPVGEQAISTLKEIAIDQGSVSSFIEWTKDKGLNKFTDIEIEKTAFKSAERQFLDGNTDKSLKLLEEYLKDYPKGSFSKVVLYYLAEIYFDKEFFDKALVAYKELIEDNVSSYTEKALVRVIIILKNNDQQITAIPYMEKLAEISSYKENKRFAILNLMQAYYSNEEHEKTLETIEKVLGLTELTENIKIGALKFKARSSLALLDSLKAGDTYKQLENSSQILIAAEAIYFRAELLNRKKAYFDSNKLISKIAENGGQAKKWNAKALLLLAKNYFALEDSFQAIFILDSLIDNFENYPEVVQEAQKLRIKYQASLEKSNRSIINDDVNG